MEQHTEIQLQIPSIKEVYKEKFTIGVALASSVINNEHVCGLIDKHFNSITHENDMKPEAILGLQPIVGVDGWPILNFDKPNQLLDYMMAYNTAHPDTPIGVRGHVLVWHTQTPDWFFRQDYDITKGYVSKEVMNIRLEWYIKSVLTYYHGEQSKYSELIYAWDVINEVIEPEDNKLKGLRKTVQFDDVNVITPYYAIYGASTEYICNSFIYANRYAPQHVKLYYNDYDEVDAVKKDLIYALLQELQQTEGVRIDGLGMQAHYAIDKPTLNEIECAIRQYASLGLEIQITELDMKVASVGEDTYEDALEKQGKHFQALFKQLIKLKEEGVPLTNVTVWGPTDAYSWLNVPKFAFGKKHYPLLFDKDNQAKPSYWGMIDAVGMVSVEENS